ncbi:hypothetical protein U6A24_02130 [Aquimarina gracilis]|uniref:Uncharacterized protein n=1 Tax=Aquimarina gracilis TaxID=874422 RepID=A0ABU5ZSI6_9FLAO|nr:hypothetical protein [Aquimarina gracilis]MEB3344236.1 hypothetical protein [Aquimarina gracilis]
MRFLSFMNSVLFLLVLGCKSKPENSVKNYTLVEENGISVEVFDSIITAEDRYTSNNITFKKHTEFIYSYKHISPNGEVFLFEEDHNIDDWRYAWRFVNSDSITQNSILKVKIKVKPGLQPFLEQIPDYNQTVLQYNYITKNEESLFNSVSGVIENENNIWMHPPRDKYFRILELNPFPFIKAPFKVGNKWNWSLKIGSSWGEKRWKTWQGAIENKYNYKITSKKKLNTKFGKIECYEIRAEAISSIGKTELQALFNPKYGFVELNYINIDGSKTNLTLEDCNEF